MSTSNYTLQSYYYNNQTSDYDAVLLICASLITAILTPFFFIFWRLFILILMMGIFGSIWSSLTVLSGERAHYSGVRPYFFVMFAADLYILLVSGFNEWLERGLGFVANQSFLGLENLCNESCKISRRAYCIFHTEFYFLCPTLSISRCVPLHNHLKIEY